MTAQNFGDRFNTFDTVKTTGVVTNDPVVANSDPFADRSPVDPALLHEVPMGGTLAAVSPLEETVAAEIPMLETPTQEIPMGGTVAPVGPMDVTDVYEAPVSDAPAYETLASEPAAYEAPFSEAVVYEAAVVEAVVYEVPVSEAIPADGSAEATRPIPYQAPQSEVVTPITPAAVVDVKSLAALLNREDSEHFRTRWNEIQGKFVDEPRTAVQQADALVSEVIGQITRMFADEHTSLEGQWNQGNDVSTEELRKALQRYRSFFNRLVI